jgi:hypothetical protein
MRIAGINWIAVLVATLIFIAIGYVIHMQMVDLAAWDAAKHTDQGKLSQPRMALGMLLPLATCIGLALLFRWGNVVNVGEGVKRAIVVALASALPTLWYDWFYGTAPIWIFWVDSAHQLAGHAAAGVILARWR